MAILQTRELKKYYGAGDTLVKALDGVELSVENGEFVAIIGTSGSGKSTLIQHLNGLLKPTSGQVLFQGTDIWSDPKTTRQTRFQVGLVFQYPEYQLFEETVYQDISFGPKNMGLDEAEVDRRVREAAHFVGLRDEQLEKSPFELSGGQKRRVAIAGVIAMEPKVLILDEPGNDLDTDMLALVEDLLDSWPGTLILVTHDRFLMERVTDQQWALIGGTLRHVPGGVDEYLRLTEGLSAGGSARPQAPGFNGGQGGDPNPSNAPQTGAQGPQNGLSNAERQRLKKEVASLERKMETRRAKVEELERGMFGIDPTDFAALTAQQDAVAAARDELDELEMAWLEASERLETSI